MAFIGTGTSLTWESGFHAEILDLSPPGASRESIQTSHMGTSAAHTFLPADLVDWGEMTVEVALFPGTTVPITSAASEAVITFSDSAASTWTFNGFMTGFEPSVPFEERATGSSTVKVTGAVTQA